MSDDVFHDFDNLSQIGLDVSLGLGNGYHDYGFGRNSRAEILRAVDQGTGLSVEHACVLTTLNALMEELMGKMNHFPASLCESWPGSRDVTCLKYT